MDREELQELISRALKTCNLSTTTDWLAYCIHKSVEFKILGNEAVVTKKSIKSGIPAVSFISIIDNDFYEIQDDNWKDQYKLLCRKNFTICIETIDDIKIIDDNNVNIHTNRIYIAFDDPDCKLH